MYRYFAASCGHKGAINGLMSELMEQHLHHHVLKRRRSRSNELDEFLKSFKEIRLRKVLDDIALYIIQFFIIFRYENEPRFCLIGHRH